MQLATCHPERKSQARGLCKSCYDRWLKSVNPTYREAQKNNTSRWHKLHPDRIKAINKRRQEREKNEPRLRISKRNSWLKRKYNLTHTQYLEMLASQNGGCAICNRRPALNKHLHVDHDHLTNRVRGLLCHQCNWYLGTVDSDPEIINRIIKYRQNILLGPKNNE